jgi:hypothetical protein
MYATYVSFHPSKAKLNATYVSVALTIISGTLLVMGKPSHMVQSCLMGLAYLSGMFFCIISAHKKLAKRIAE